MALLALTCRGATLTCTAPTLSQARWMAFDPEVGDSVVQMDCEGTTALVESLWVTLWWQPISGGGFHPADSSWVAPGDSVRFFGVLPGNGYVLARNSVGTSCAGNMVYVAPSDVTAVEPVPSRQVVKVRLFDVRGRLIRGKPAAGVYFERRWFRDGSTETRRVVILR